ncbi:hypothetical protein OPV22_009302 [Ensete ventricosum]|uniref:Uncharacterized protein n=1 Tax=Ensete ventricosum TaxID=4639 RepID=A0AAV8RAP3_ENSVE|nr:hypothetical protein OPV22_009302 [Ensete ventricosum]
MYAWQLLNRELKTNKAYQEWSNKGSERETPSDPIVRRSRDQEIYMDAVWLCSRIGKQRKHWVYTTLCQPTSAGAESTETFLEVSHG